MRPEDLWTEQLVADADISAHGTAVWLVRRPMQNPPSYQHELWYALLNGQPTRVSGLPDLAGRVRLDHTGWRAVATTSAEGATAIVIDLASSSWHPIGGCTGVDKAEPNPVNDSVALLVRPQEDDANRLESPIAREICDQNAATKGRDPRNRRTRLVLMTKQGERPVLLPAGLELGSFGWADDGRTLWFTAGQSPYVERATQLWIADMEDLEPRLYLEAPGAISSVSWTGHGLALAIRGPHFWADQTRLYVAAGGSTELTRVDGGGCIEPAILSDVLPLSDSTVAWTQEGDVLAVVTQAGEPFLGRFRGSKCQLASSPGLHVAAVRAQGPHLLVIGQAGRRSFDVWHGQGGKWHRVSDHGGWLAESRWPAVERLRPMGNSGVLLDSWIFHSGDATASDPLVVHLHGGPYNAHGPLPWLEIALLVSCGFSVLCPNPRGSVSYGDSYSRALLGRWGEIDVEDVEICLRAALQSGYGDPDRVAVMGLSYGGYLAAQMLIKDGTARAGIIENAPMNLVSFVGVSDLAGARSEDLIGLNGLQALWTASPLAEAARITAPVLLLGSERDTRVPPGELQQMFVELARNKTPVRYISYPEEGHLMFAEGRPDRRIHRLNIIREWLHTYLTGRDAGDSIRI